jgi:uncharacterized delta-60 repeat protein
MDLFPGFRVSVLLVVLLALLAVPAGALAARVANEGAPDRSFAGDGRLVTDLDGGSKDRANAVLPYEAGRTVVAGYSIKAPFGVRLAVALYRPDGSLDPAFGDGGIVLSDVEGGMSADAMVLDSTSSIVVAGSGSAGERSGDPAVARLLRDGRLDSSFGGGDGMVRVPVEMDVAAIRSDGNAGIFLAGTLKAGVGGDSDFAVAHLLRDGSMDLGFGGDGLVTLNLSPEGSEEVNDMMLDGLGRIHLVGGAWFPQRGVNRHVGRFALARLHPDGSLDRSFAGRGYATYPLRESGSYASAGALDVSGRAILAGKSGPPVAFTAVDEGGRIDRSYGKRGVTLFDVSQGEYLPWDVADDSHRRIVAALGTNNPSTPRRGDMRCLRLRADGSLDRRFSRDGQARVGMGRHLATARAVAFQPNGKILLAGFAKLPGSPDTDFVVVRLRGGV